jgi:hypothetical protein
MNKFTLGISVLMALPLVALAQVDLSVVPTNACIHVCEPVSFKVSVQNKGASDISGIFILGGAYQGFEIDIEKLGNGSKDRFYNAQMREMIAYDMMLQPVTLKAGEAVSGNYCFLYNVHKGSFVFETPGEYKVHFRLLWNPKDGDTVSATAHVTVVGLDKAKEEDGKQLEALALWKDRDIAAAVQDKAELKSGASDKLQELKEKYAGTLYGKLASELLAEARTH